MYEKTILCLAVSRKPPSGRCVAGKECAEARIGEWIRPVSAREGKEVSEEERRYEDGSRAQLLDIITVPLERSEPVDHQRENHVLAEDYYWTKEGRASWAQVRGCLDAYDASFWMPAQSTFNGLNDKISEDDAGQVPSSLKLILVPQLEISVRHEAGYQGRPGRRRVRGSFQYQRSQYILSVTDPEIEEEYLRQGLGDYRISDAALCISLSEPIYGYAFRLIASVITEERCDE